jgi:hypothetical protein
MAPTAMKVGSGKNRPDPQHCPLEILTAMLIVLDGDGPHRDEENPAHQVDEELQDGEVGAQQVGHQHRRHNYRVPVPQNS